jgi:hypothetical protein
MTLLWKACRSKFNECSAALACRASVGTWKSEQPIANPRRASAEPQIFSINFLCLKGFMCTAATSIFSTQSNGVWPESRGLEELAGMRSSAGNNVEISCSELIKSGQLCPCSKLGQIRSDRIDAPLA